MTSRLSILHPRQENGCPRSPERSGKARNLPCPILSISFCRRGGKPRLSPSQLSTRHENGCPRSGFSDLGKHATLIAHVFLFFAALTAAAQTGHYRVAGIVVNAITGEPISGATVSLLTLQENATFAATQSGADGRFDIENLPAAKYQLTAMRRGYCTASYNQHGNFNSAIVTGAGQDTASLVFKLAPEAVLSGVVTGDGGDPVAGATVILFEKPHNRDPGVKIEEAATATTDDTGSWEFPNLTSGEYLLAVRAQPWYAVSHFSTDLYRRPETPQQAALDVAYPTTFFDSTIDEASATPIVLSPGSRQQANINLHAVPAVHIEVQAPAKPDGSIAQPELRQTVFGLDVPGGGPYMSRGRDGIVEFGGIAPGNYELTQGDPPRIVDLNASSSQQVDPAAGAPAFAINGTLQTLAGAAPSGTSVLTLDPAVPGDASPSPSVAVATPRAFTFNAVPAGSWRLHAANGPDIVSITAEGRTHPGNLLTVQDHALSIIVTVSAGRTVRVEGVVRKAGVPADRSSSVGWKGSTGFAGAMVVLVPNDPTAMAELGRRDQSDSDGTFALPNAEPGSYTVVAIEDGWDLDWSNPAVIARYLPGGQPVTVTDIPNSQPENGIDRRMTLPEPVVVQPK